MCAAAVARVSGTLSKSTEVMQSINKLIKIPELTKTLQEMSKGKQMDDLFLWCCVGLLSSDFQPVNDLRQVRAHRHAALSVEHICEGELMQIMRIDPVWGCRNDENWVD